MSALGKAAARFDAAFSALPEGARQAAALAMYRVAPAFEQYQRDLAPIADSPELVEAIWDIALAVACRLAFAGGRDGLKQKHLDEMKERAPATFDFIVRVGRLIEGVLPGGPQRRQLTPAPLALSAPDDK